MFDAKLLSYLSYGSY